MKFLSILLLSLTLTFTPAISKEVEVDLELALGVDVSGSVDDEEAMLQRKGYIQAFKHPAILDAIQRGPLGRIAVGYYEWAGFGHMKIIAPWTLIHDRKTALAFANILSKDPPQTARRTAISAGIMMGANWFDQNHFKGLRRVIDISGDGPNNWGEPVNIVRDRIASRGITINGLPIVNERPTFSGRPPVKDLDLYYRDCVIGGPRAFYVVAKDFRDFGRAVMRKLIMEIANVVEPKLFHRAQYQKRRGPPCDIGEKQRIWQSFDEDEFYFPLPQKQ
jgi:hypothetical protein